MIIENLGLHRDWIGTIARWHFEQWGILTGSETLEEHGLTLARFAQSPTIPTVLVACSDGQPQGSVSLVACDMTIRSALTPWLAQLFVTPAHRKAGIGGALVEAAVAHVQKLRYDQLYLYTSGELPRFYERLGWGIRETVHYLGKKRAVMQFSVAT